MKNSNLSIILFSFLFSLSISIIFSILSYFYIQETIESTEAKEKHEIACYANKITYQTKSIEELKKKTFGTVESFLYKMAIIDRNLNVLYSTFEKNPYYDISRKTYIDDNHIFYNDNKYFSDVGEVRVVLQKNLDYDVIKNKIIMLSIGGLFFFLICFFILYFIISKLFINISEALDRFFRNAIHEIRTPLGVLQINLEFLENTLKDSMALKRAQGGLNNLTSVYESIEFCIKHKKVSFPKENIDISHFLKARIDFFKVLADIKGIKLDTSIKENIFMHISRTEIQRLIDNNLSNALKYSKENTTIEIQLMLNKNDIILVFTNEGQKIPNFNKLFQQFYRGDNINSGFGLGLDIMMHICTQYNIEIGVKSEKGKNSFLYKIPNTLNKRLKDD